MPFLIEVEEKTSDTSTKTRDYEHLDEGTSSLDTKNMNNKGEKLLMKFSTFYTSPVAKYCVNLVR